MTRLPDLEAELVAAAQRRYGRAPARRRVNLAWVRPRLLVPIATFLLVVIVASATLRGQDPEVEAPLAPVGDEPGAAAVGNVMDSPLGPLIRNSDSTPDTRFPPVTLAVRDAAGTEWFVAVYGTRGADVCVVAAPTGMEKDPGAGAGCTNAAIIAEEGAAAEGDLLTNESATTRGGIVFGLVTPGVQAVEVKAGAARARAARSSGVFTRPVTDAEREAVRLHDRVPAARELKVRLFAAAFTAGQVPAGVRSTDVSLVLTAGGSETESRILTTPPEEQPRVFCNRDARLDDTEGHAPPAAGEPVALCRKHWDAGGFGAAARPEQLTACEASDGTVYVFPGDDERICRRLGQKPYRDS